jgi:uncharacterized membrane protein
MTMKRAAYGTLTGLLCAWLALGGILDVARVTQTRAIMQTLHYPDYMLLILGPCKLLAILALLYPKTRYLREWAYAGITIDALGAFFSHTAVHDNFFNALAPLLMLAIAAGSYVLRPAGVRLVPQSAK